MKTEQYDLPNEQFRDIIKYPQVKGKYQVSNLGRIKSFRRKKIYYTLGSKDNNGYLKLDIYYQGRRLASPKIHDLVAETFLRTIDYQKEVVHHKSQIKTENNLSNLKILSISQHRAHHNYGKQYMLGKSFSQEHKRKISQALKGRPKTEDHKRKISNTLKQIKSPQ